jgi:Tfp pilus assembly protein PilO
VSDERPFWRRVLLPVVIGLLALNVALAVWTLPRHRKQLDAASRVEAARAEVRRERAQTMALRERAALLRANAADVQRFYERYAGTEKADLVPTVEAVETLARLPGLRTGARTYAREQVGVLPLERLVISLPVDGTYEQLVAFLREVERSPRFLTVDEVTMQGRAGSAQLRVQLSTYLKLSPGEIQARSSGRGR